MIDWTKPVETDEENPRAVRVLCTDAHPSRGEVIILIEGTSCSGLWRCRKDSDGPWWAGSAKLRNVRPKPVNREGWVNVFFGGQSTYLQDQRIHPTRAEADRATARDSRCLPVRIELEGMP